MKNTLYVIGNGFDRYHDLPTRYQDFHKYILENELDVENSLEEYFQLRREGDNESLWSNFEDDLGTFIGERFFDEHCHINPQDDDFRPSFVYSLEDDMVMETEDLVDKIRKAFGEWIEKINIEEVCKKGNIANNVIFLNFNYTSTLEKVYGVDREKVFHIHGSIEDLDSLVFGHGKDIDDTGEYDEDGVPLNESMFSRAEAISKSPFYSFKKPVMNIIEENNAFFKKLHLVNEVIILGHSMNKIDLPYFEEILKNTTNSSWKVSFFGEAEKEKHYATLSALGIDSRLITQANIETLFKP